MNQFTIQSENRFPNVAINAFLLINYTNKPGQSEAHSLRSCQAFTELHHSLRSHLTFEIIVLLMPVSIMAAEQPTAGAENTNAINEADFAKVYR